MKQMFCSGPGAPPELASLRLGISLKSKITVIVLEIVVSISHCVWDQITERFILFFVVHYAKTTFKYRVSHNSFHFVFVIFLGSRAHTKEFS